MYEWLKRTMVNKNGHNHYGGDDHDHIDDNNDNDHDDHNHYDTNDHNKNGCWNPADINLVHFRRVK